jgi:uncharacterized protein
MNHLSKVALLACSMILPFESSHALEVPRLSKRVTDLANMVTPADENHIEQRLRAHEAETSNQIAVLTVPSLEGEIIEEYALKVAETWALGQKDKDNGALIISARDDRKLRIEVGYGLEGTLTDVYAGRIVRDVMVPQLKAGNPSGAIRAGADAVLAILDGDATMREQLDSSGSTSGESEELTWQDILILLGFIGFMVLRSMFGGGMRTSRRYGGGFYSSGSGGGSSFGGGGGSFGGGGSSGSW